MRLILMRHGLAAERQTWNAPDALRPLTQEGQKKTQQAVAGLKTIESKIDVLACSPLIRARQTAEIVRFEYSNEIEIWPELEDANFETLNARLQFLPDATVLCVGHEPGLGEFTARILGRSGFDLKWKKAGVAVLQLEYSQEGVHAVLEGFYPPRVLRALK